MDHLRTQVTTKLGGPALILALPDFILGPIAAAAMFVGRLAIFWVWSQTRHTFLITARLSETVPETVEVSEIA